MSLTCFPVSKIAYNLDKCCEEETTPAVRGPPLTPKEKPAGAVPNAPHVKPRQRIKPSTEVSTKLDEEILREEKLKKKRDNMRKRREEFFEKGVMTALYGTIEQKVQSALLSTDHILDQRRNRLRELLLAEEVAYTTEYVGLCQQANTIRAEEMRDRALKVKQKNERERREFAEKKRMEQKVLSCDAARPILSQKHLIKLKEDQLWQIKEKYAKVESQKEEDRMYHDLMLKNIQAMKENEEELAKLNWKKQKEAQESFIEQLKLKEQKEIQERQLKEFERLQLEEELRLLKGEGEKEKEEIRLKREKLKNEARELLLNAMKLKERRKREEEEIDQTFSALMRIEEEKEKRKEKSDKQRLKREMDIFIEKTKELKMLKEQEERKIDALITEFNQRRRQEKDAERRKVTAAREELFQNVLRGRELQIKEKRERERREAESEMREIQLMELQIEQHKKIRDEYERKCAQQREEYKCHLLKQIAEVEEIKKRTKEEEAEFMRRMQEAQDEEIEEVMRLLKKLPFDTVDHPFKAVIEENAPKYPCLYPYLK